MNQETKQTAMTATTKTKRPYKVKNTSGGGGGAVGMVAALASLACVAAAPSIPAYAMSAFYSGGVGSALVDVVDFETDQRRREMFNEQIGATWRAWAKNEVSYSEDFPTALLTLTEFIDNSIGKGKATKVWVEFIIIDPLHAFIIIRDNGIGIDSHGNLVRFTTIAALESSDGNHRYGMGRFCALTKFAPEYSTAKWCATFKFDDNTSHMKQISWPWSLSNPMMTSMKKIPIDDSNRDIGLEIVIQFNPSEILKDLAMNPRKLFEKMKERLTTKYGKALLDSFELDLTVRYGATTVVTENSKKNNWKAFEQALNDNPSCRIVFKKKITYFNLDVEVTQYSLEKSKKCQHMIALKKEFPTFGSRNENGQRVHIYNDDRLIESRRKYLMDGRKGHDGQNDEIVILKTVSTPDTFHLQPEPATIKVSVDKECKNLKNIYKIFREEFKKEQEANAHANPKPTPVQKKKSAKVPKSKQSKTSSSIDVALAGGGVASQVDSVEIVASAASESQISQKGVSEYEKIELINIDDPSITSRHSASVVSTTKKSVFYDEDAMAIRQIYLNSSGDVEQFMAELKAQFSGAN